MNGLLSGAVEAPGPLLLAWQFLAELAARLKRGCGAGDMTCLFVFTAAKSLSLLVYSGVFSVCCLVLVLMLWSHVEPEVRASRGG